MLHSLNHQITLQGLLEKRLNLDLEYLNSFQDENLIRPFLWEAGLIQITYMPDNVHGGWDSPLSPLRGAMTGHWLSAVAMSLKVKENPVLKARADAIVSELERCQKEHGNGWCFSIPEKTLMWLKRGKRTWAPIYVCHKTMMGLFDMYRYAGNEKAFEIVEKAAEWFLEFTKDVSEEAMQRILEEEYGGMMELFAELYGVTGKKEHYFLMKKFEKRELFDALENGNVNPLQNKHANSTIPLIHGACRCYEVTGERRYQKIAERYWNLAVEENEGFCTDGHTCGEQWCPPGTRSQRIGVSNQEHCTVYNMMRLAMYLLNWTGESKYADYWEKNFYNGILAQGFKYRNEIEQLGAEKNAVVKDVVAYYLPLMPGSKKYWGSRFDDFWCCHGTLMQANAFLYQGLLGWQEDILYVHQFQDMTACFEWKEAHTVLKICREGLENEKEFPLFQECRIELTLEKGREFSLAVRVPAWSEGKCQIWVNEEKVSYYTKNGYAFIKRNWNQRNTILVRLDENIHVEYLNDEKTKGAFCIGPIVLAGIVSEERKLRFKDSPEELLISCNTRMWDEWNFHFLTKGQDQNIFFKPLYEVSEERYTVYFPIEREK